MVYIHVGNQQVCITLQITCRSGVPGVGISLMDYGKWEVLEYAIE